MEVLHNDRGQHYSVVFTNATAVNISSADQTFDYPSQLFVGGAGDIKVDTPESTAVTFTEVPVGIFPVLVTKVYKIGTDATNMVAIR